MKFLVLSTLLIIGACYAESPENGQGKVLRRVVRQAMDNMGGQFLVQIEATVISNCKANGYKDVQDDLENSYAKLKQCVAKKSLFIDSKEDFISNMEECSEESIRKTKNCLADDQKYFPQFVLDLAKSMVNFMYEDFDIMRDDLPICIRSFGSYPVQRKYIQCLTDTAAQTHDTTRIPSSKASFCQKFIPASRCFTDMIKNNCRDSPNLRKFREDYMNAMEVPCGIKESA